MPNPDNLLPIWGIYSFSVRGENKHFVMTGLTREEADFRLHQLRGREQFVASSRLFFTNKAAAALHLQYQERERLRVDLADKMAKLPYWVRRRCAESVHRRPHAIRYKIINMRNG